MYGSQLSGITNDHKSNQLNSGWRDVVGTAAEAVVVSTIRLIRRVAVMPGREFARTGCKQLAGTHLETHEHQ